MTTIAPSQLYQDLRSSGFDPLPAAAFVAIAGRESNYKVDAINTNAGTKDYSPGLFQINLYPGGTGGWYQFLVASGLSNPTQDLETEQGSITAARAIYGHSGLEPWGGYKGVPWYRGTNLQAAAAASGGEVTATALQQFAGTGGVNENVPVAEAGPTAPDTSSGGGCPEGNLLTLPSILPNITRCQGRAMLGAVTLVGGMLLIVLGVAVLAGRTKAGKAVIAAAPLVA